MPDKPDKLAVVAYDRIKRGILSLEYQPGTVLQERALAGELNMSRTPVREAVQRLAQQGWLKISARKCLNVREVNFDEMRQTFQARSLLELAVLEMLFTCGRTAEAAEQMKRLDGKMSQLEGQLFQFIVTDQMFHAVPFHVVGNKPLLRFWQTVSDEMIWYGMLAMTPFRYSDVLAEHGKVVEALRLGKVRLSRQSLQEHLNITEQMLVTNDVGGEDRGGCHELEV
ncbi:transcriptional regulator [Jonquetella anthropi DSM 22815]|uniref:Transcriptional regulator n=1 Tax=Jonquetella anthropi DSM 22815 TaxID=885272 RepID=H0UIS4_9BACT|nr:GntR family transcriptional regulator [Jonquetella anthropi]EEX48947.1 transcriptional regulator, GntR family [Jonquetella anthropi E3_33 E1]EHM12718.1 transcriptional regulator [Jonquetella anthropi DSM 22815]